MSSKANTGTIKGIAVWYRQQRWSDGARVELHAVPMEGAQLVSSWSVPEIRQGVDLWTEEVDAVASTDATGRETSTKYELRNIDDEGRVRGIMHLRRVVAPRDGDDDTKPTGTAESIIQQLQRSLERANAQVIESARVAVQVAQSAVDSQRASMALLGQAYQTIGALQQSNVLMHADQIEKPKPREKSVGDVAFEEVVKLAVPVLARKVISEMTGDDEDETEAKKEH